MEIKISKGAVAVIDDDDFHLVREHRWFLSSGGYAARKDNTASPGKTVYMHRLILNTPDGMLTDHINGNKLDNRRANLRVCNCAQNTMNQKKRGNKSSKFKGVSFFSKSKKWAAQIYTPEREFLGLFSSETEAAEAYNEAAIKHFGEFSNLNKVGKFLC